MQVLVTGASGNVGRSALHAVRALGLEAIPTTVDGRALDGEPSRRLDFEDSTTWAGALDGVDRLFLLRPPQISKVRSTLSAFVDLGRPTLKHVVFLSVTGAERTRIIPHAKVEAHLRETGIPWTFLRAGFFAQNLTGAYRQDIRDDDRIYVPAGRGTPAWVDTRDLGEAAARAFLDESARNAVWTLTGPEANGFAEVAGMLTEALGRPIRYDPASIAGSLWHQRVRRRQSLGEATVFCVLHTLLRFSADPVDPTLARVLGRRPYTVRDTIRDFADVWRR